MGYIARRDGNTITLPYVVGGPLTIIHEASNGFMVVKWPSRKHWKTGYPRLPVRYVVARLLTGTEADEARIRTTCNSDGYAEAPDVYLDLGHRVDAGSNWRAARAACVEFVEESAARA